MLISVLKNKKLYNFNLFIALVYHDSGVLLWGMAILVIAQNHVWNTLINECITDKLKMKVAGFDVLGVFTFLFCFVFNFNLIAFLNQIKPNYMEKCPEYSLK